jgi:hypothetical protein
VVGRFTCYACRNIHSMANQCKGTPVPLTAGLGAAGGADIGLYVCARARGCRPGGVGRNARVADMKDNVGATREWSPARTSAGSAVRRASIRRSLRRSTLHHSVRGSVVSVHAL